MLLVMIMFEIQVSKICVQMIMSDTVKICRQFMLANFIMFASLQILMQTNER